MLSVSGTCRQPHGTRRATVVAATAGLLTFAVSPIATAGNAAEPRVPPSFLGGNCLEVIRPGDDPLWLPIGIPLEELDATADEPPGTRSFQFFAVCREPFPGEELPPWIDVADIDAAQLANPEILTPGEALVLSTSTWAGCVRPLTSGQARMPITCEGTAAGLSIDADTLPAGNHVVYGYTYEPDKNVWTPRSGVVRVLDERGESALPPAVAFSFPVSDATASTGLGVTLTGCAAGLPGTTIALAWATASDLIAFGDDAWETFATVPLPDADDATGGAFSVPFEPPAGSEYSVVKFRALAVDPSGASWQAYTRQPLVLEPGCAEPSDGTELVADLCGVGNGEPEPTDRNAGLPARTQCAEPTDDDDDDDDASTSGQGSGPDEGTSVGTTGDDSTDDGVVSESASDGETGCACTLAEPSRHGGPWAVLVGLLALVRRRSSARLRRYP